MTAPAWAAWTSFGLVMCTACRPGTASSSSSESNGGGSSGLALARVRAGDEPTIPTTSTPMRRSASVCTSAIHPVPTIPARIASLSADPIMSPVAR